MILKRGYIGRIILNEKNVKIIFVKYIGAITIAGLITIFCLVTRDFFNQTNLKDRYLYLSDSFTISGLLFILFAILIYLSNKGAIDALSYMFFRFWNMLIPFRNKKEEKYSEYVMKKTKVSNYCFIFIVGLFYLFLGLIFTILFNSY